MIAITNAINDILVFNFKSSVFQDLDPKIWNPNVDYKTAYNFLGWFRIDLFHFNKGIMVSSIIGAVVSRIKCPFTYGLILDGVILSFIWLIFFEGVTKVLRRPFKESSY